MEIEKRKQVEEVLSNMQTQWKRIHERLSLVGLNFPPNPVAGEELDSEQPDDQVEDLCQQVHVIRIVSETIGRGIAKAELETETEAQIESKNFEIARLWDRLSYYEAVNREMSQRNQEAIGEFMFHLTTYNLKPMCCCMFKVGMCLFSQHCSGKCLGRSFICCSYFCVYLSLTYCFHKIDEVF